MSAWAHRASAVIIMAFLLVFALLVTPVAAAFSDTRGHWALSAIESLAANDIIGGYPDNTFRPEQPITRGEFAKLVATAFEVASADRAAFSDTVGHWASGSIAGLAERGFVQGYPDGTFRPDEPITRAESVWILAKVREVADIAWFAGGADAHFVDVEADHWAYSAAQAMESLGVLPAFVDGRFQPDAELTRAEAAWMVYQSMRLGLESGTVTFVDPATSRVTIQTQQGRVRDFRTDSATLLVRGDAIESLDGLDAGETVFIIADRFGTPQLIEVGEAGSISEDLTQRIASAVLDVFTVEELQQMLAGDWSAAAHGVQREVTERLTEAGISTEETQALLAQDWSSLQESVISRLQAQLTDTLQISDELASALINRDWTTAREQAQLEVAEHLLNRLLATMDTQSQA